MIEREELCDRSCVASLIQVMEQVPIRAAVPEPITIDRATVALLLLWSLLRWERTFVIQTLESLGVDLWPLTQAVDEALRSCSNQSRGKQAVVRPDELDAYLRYWLTKAAAEARSMRHNFIGNEHLLLALLGHEESPCGAICQPCGLSYDTFKEAVVAALADEIAAPAIQMQATKPKTLGWIDEIDRPAVGVPRRFGVFIMRLMVTLYAVLFSILRVVGANNLVFVLLALLFTGIGIGQALLFGGRYPRLASIWIGAILVPIESIVLCCFPNDFIYLEEMSRLSAIIIAVAVLVCSIPFGAILGYLFGTVTAGGFWLVDRYEKRQESAEETPSE